MAKSLSYRWNMLRNRIELFAREKKRVFECDPKMAAYSLDELRADLCRVIAVKMSERDWPRPSTRARSISANFRQTLVPL
jgi:hypothetical protein